MNGCDAIKVFAEVGKSRQALGTGNYVFGRRSSTGVCPLGKGLARVKPNNPGNTIAPNHTRLERRAGSGPAIQPNAKWAASAQMTRARTGARQKSSGCDETEPRDDSVKQGASPHASSMVLHDRRDKANRYSASPGLDEVHEPVDKLRMSLFDHFQNTVD